MYFLIQYQIPALFFVEINFMKLKKIFKSDVTVTGVSVSNKFRVIENDMEILS